jgi:signal transduction histidine kinase
MVITQADEGAAAPPWFARLSRSSWLARRPAPDVIDGLIAAGCFGGFTLPVLTGLASRIGSPAAVAGFGVLAAAPLIVRRRWPATTVAATGAVYVAATLAGVRFTPWVSNAGPNFAIAVFTAADRRPRRVSLTVSVLAGVATWAVLPLSMYVLHPGQGQDAVQLAAMVPAWLAGDTVRARRTYRQRLDAETRRRAAEEQARARAEERLRLSREVHDVVSHSLSMIAVRSGVARMLLDERPEEARAALSTIETASRSALDEVRNLLRQIRGPAAAEETAMPTLADLPALVDRLRDGGLDLSYRCTGEPAGYGAALELSAYRIAQEALTNVAKHAPGARAWLEVAHGGSELTIKVADDGRGAPQPASGSAGLGIVGMRERAAMLGGQLTAGARPEGGFAVVARLPAEDGRVGGAWGGRPPEEVQ